MSTPTSRLDLNALRRLTPSRVHFDASARAQDLRDVLDFQACHARARDAIHQPTDWAAISSTLAPRECVHLVSKATDRKTYLARPDLGRTLSDASQEQLRDSSPVDLAIVLADGLSSFAVENNGPALISALGDIAPDMANAPVFLVEQARVAIGDHIATALQAEAVLVLIGERPGLSVSDSLGAYFTWDPQPGLPDSRRNCVSNIHRNGGLSAKDAAGRIAWLWREAGRMGTSGVTLKDMSDTSKAISGDRAPMAERTAE